MKTQTLAPLALFCLAAAAAAEPAIPAAVAGGDIVVHTEQKAGSDVPVFVARALVDAPPAVVWSIVSRCADYKKTMPRIADSAELAREGSVVRCRVTADLPFPFSDLTSISRAVHTEDAAAGRFKREWTFLEGDYKINEGAWVLEPVDGGKRTYAVYRLHVKPDIPLPSSLAALFQKGPLVDVMKAVRAESASRLGPPTP